MDHAKLLLNLCGITAEEEKNKDRENGKLGAQWSK
jgi:hypothetical protein